MGQVKVQSATNAERRVVAAIRGRPASDGAGVKRRASSASRRCPTSTRS